MLENQKEPKGMKSLLAIIAIKFCVCRLHEERMKQEEESRRRMLPHFETAEERELRLKQEKELEEFGKAAVEFSLSSPDPRFRFT